jgi:hypothetical protein
MTVAGSTGPVMSREEVDRALARLGAEYEAIESSLLALQDHTGRRLLEGAELTGTTKERWIAAEPAVALLWSHLNVYGDALRSAREVRGRRRWPSQPELAQLTDLLRGTGVTISGGDVPDEARSLTGPAVLSERISLERLLERMNGWYEQVMAVVGAADVVWSALPARIDALAAEAQRVRSLARSVGVEPGAHPSGDDLEQLLAELAALRVEVVGDPLAFWLPVRPRGGGRGGRPDMRRYERAEHDLEDIRREVEAVLHVRDDAEHRLRRLQDVLSRADRTLAEARLARGEVLAKIAASEVPAVSGPSAALHDRFLAATGYRRQARWHLLSPLLDDLEQRADEELQRARASLTAVTAPLAVRAELRGRLDAYKAKAARHAAAEDPLLVERYDQARRLLWSAPCDLRAAEQAVARYQQAVAEVLVPDRTGPADHGGDIR